MIKPLDTFFTPAHGRLPSYSGLTRVEGTKYLAVHDFKSFDETSPRLTTFDNASGASEVVDVDWSATGIADDLEAISKVDGTTSSYLAVEGSRYNGRTPGLLLLNYADGKAESEARFDLPVLPYEVEGLATKQQPDGKVLILLGGRGDSKSAEGRLHWATYDPAEKSVDWSSQAGVEGVAVKAPQSLGQGERAISELQMGKNGEVWASSCLDEGDYGPFTSTVYRLGVLNNGSASSTNSPVTLTVDRPVPVTGQKIEALELHDTQDTNFLFGSDNEAQGGMLSSLMTRYTA